MKVPPASKKVLRGSAVLTLAAALLLGLPARPAAHEIPASVVVQALVKPEDGRLRLLVRVPLPSMRDIEFPLTEGGTLDLAALRPALQLLAETWIAHYVRIYENGEPLELPRVVATRVSLPSDASFGTYESALANVTGAGLPDETALPWESALFDVLLETPVASVGSRFSLEPEWAHLGVRTATVLRFVTPDGAERAFTWDGDPGLVRLDPRWHQAAWSFVTLGFRHILGGIDHLLFVLCLVIPFRRFVPLIALVTAFTIAHSITLAAAALGFAPTALWFPALVETLIAASIVWMALENVLGAKLRRRWAMTFAFGLIHGFGFSFLLTESLQFAGSHLALSLVAFNVGVELGQIVVLAVGVPALVWLFRRVPERAGMIVVSALVAHTAWHWMTERGGELLQHPFVLPAFDALFVAQLMRWAMGLLIVIGVAWGLSGLLGRLTDGRASDDEAPEAAATGAAGAEA